LAILTNYLDEIYVDYIVHSPMSYTVREDFFWNI